MKKIITTALFATLLYGNHTLAQDLLLPYDDTWDAKCFYSTNNTITPDDNWFETDYSDLSWESIASPINRSTVWKDHYSTYWLRRHFVVDDVTKYCDGDFHLLYDCDGIAYLNGQKIYEWSGYNTTWVTIAINKSIMETIHKGDNVLAVRVKDNGGDTFINFGLSGWTEQRNYYELRKSLESLQRRLNENNTNALPRTVAEATDLLTKTKTAMDNLEYDNTEADEMTKIVTSIVGRLENEYIEITVDVPGSLGDSILGKVENFSDVISLKLSGKLNDADISTIQSRLMNLREIDMTDVKMEMLPNKLFYQHKSLQKVFLPKHLTTIEEYAFCECPSIFYINFPETLTAIKWKAFSECDSLQEVILPEGFVSIGDGAFYGCDNNKYIKLPSTLKSISKDAFYWNKNLNTIDFEEGLTHIYDRAFHACYVLDNLKFPTTLNYIGAEAFRDNHALSNVIFNEGLFQIADNAFQYCYALTEVTLPSSVVRVDASPFDYCANLKKVTCLSIEPPYMTDQIPLGVSMEGRELYVPALSLNVYKQTAGWDKFQTIKPIDYLPENFTVLSDLKLTLPENIPATYKPTVSLIHDQKGTSYLQYGCLTVNGQGTLSMSDFSMIWDPNYQYVQYNRNQNYCSLVNNSHLRADNVTINMFTRNDRWNFITFPFDVKVSDISTTADGTTNWVIRKYDGQKRAAGETSDTWVKVGGNETLKAGEGYIIQGSRYIDTNWQEYSGFCINAINNTNKNNIFRTTDINVTLNEYQSEFAHNRSWNFIGNPYPCYYDTRFMDFEAPITVWNMRNNTYEAYSPSDDSYILCPGEAFFVQRPIDKGTILFNKDGRQTNRDVRVIEAPARRATVMSPRTIVNICLSDGNNTDRTRIVLNSKASMQYEMDKDASKFMSTDATVPQIYTTSDGVNYAINERPFVDGKVNLSTYFGSDSMYTIALANHVNGYEVILEDKEENKRVALTEGNGYVFSAKAKSNINRFVVHFSSEVTGIMDIHSNENGRASIFTIEGMKMKTPTRKGLYIQNGKKLMLNK